MAEFEYKTFSLHIKSSHTERKQLKPVEKVWFAEKRNWKIKKRTNRANHNDTKSASSCTISKSTKSLSFPFVALSKYKNNFRQSSVMFSKIIKPIKIISESIFLPSPLAARSVWVWILSKAGRQDGKGILSDLYFRWLNFADRKQSKIDKARKKRKWGRLLFNWNCNSIFYNIYFIPHIMIHSNSFPFHSFPSWRWVSRVNWLEIAFQARWLCCLHWAEIRCLNWF